jgi:hypothetical protein
LPGFVSLFGAFLPDLDLLSTIEALEVIMGSWGTVDAIEKVVQILPRQNIKALLFSFTKAYKKRLEVFLAKLGEISNEANSNEGVSLLVLDDPEHKILNPLTFLRISLPKVPQTKDFATDQIRIILERFYMTYEFWNDAIS